MKLYHGTSSTFVDKILQQGIKPRGRRKGNWDSHPSHPGAVYMSNAYAPYFAVQACEKKAFPAVLEIDVHKLNPFCLCPDEDFLEQAFGKREFPDWDMTQRTRYYRENLEIFAPNWELSLEHMGNCSYLGTIPSKAITRIAILDHKHKETCLLLATCLDPTISIINYHIVGKKYRGITKWIFGDDLGEDAQDAPVMIDGKPVHVGNTWTVPKNRDGIKIKELAYA